MFLCLFVFSSAFNNTVMREFRRSILAIFTFSFLSICIYAQDAVNLKLQASQYLSQKNYEKALPIYSELLKKFPKEPEYMYGMGVCYLNLNQNLEEAIQLLRAVSVTGYSPLSWYYLGRACHMNYSFEDAIKAYSRFVLNGKKSDIKAFQVERLIEMSKNGIEFTRSGHALFVQHVQRIQLSQLHLAGEINGSGKIMRKPVEFCNKTDLRNNNKSWMFLPSYTELNEYVYLSGFERSRKNGKQLFRIRNINHETWGIPEPLTDLNTPFDEEYPYFDAHTSTLYFSSKGYSSMGGYDIFKSTYDWNSKTWSKPENLGFPINSPFDDYIFITDPMDHSANFVSNREVSSNEAVIYKIRMPSDKHGTQFLNVDEVREAAKLQISQDEAIPVMEQATVNNSETKVAVEKSQSEKVQLEKNDYNRLISEALVLQIQADSSARIARDLRIMARETPDSDAKKRIVSDLIKNEKEARRLQGEADARFSSARNLREDERNDSLLKPSGTLNNIKIYQYQTSRNDSEETLVVHSNKIPVESSESFSILETSRYNNSNPIPSCSQSWDGLVYRIQLSALSKPAANDLFGGITPVCYEQGNQTSVRKYYAGVFRTLRTVNDALSQVRAHGFPDAFIVAFYNGKIIPTEKAREIEFSGQ